MFDKNRIIETLPMKGPEVERRRHTRWTLERPCKVRRASSITFEPARTVNVAPGRRTGRRAGREALRRG